MELLKLPGKHKRYFVLAAMAALFLHPQMARSWGFWGHRYLTRKAISALPDNCKTYFVLIADSLVDHSIDPDLWRRNDDREANRHYIDIDMFGPFPFKNLPHNYKKAVKKFGQEKINKAGILPWRIVAMVDSLSDAMRKKNAQLILRYASALAHYVEDAHMPLHVATNYDGQLTGNKGIHSRYERWMLEAKKKQISANVKPHSARSLTNVQKSVFGWLLSSYVWVDNLLLADSRARQPGKKYKKFKDFDSVYYNKLFAQTKSFTYLQMSRAATAVARCWLTAWQRAGKPDLSEIFKL